MPVYGNVYVEPEDRFLAISPGLALLREHYALANRCVKLSATWSWHDLPTVGRLPDDCKLSPYALSPEQSVAIVAEWRRYRIPPPQWSPRDFDIRPLIDFEPSIVSNYDDWADLNDSEDVKPGEQKSIDLLVCCWSCQCLCWRCTSTGKVYQMLSWRTKKSLHFINIWE